MGRPERYLSILEQLDMRVFSILFTLVSFSLVVMPDSASGQNDTIPWLGLVPEVVHTEGELAGMTTYRLYLYTPNETDFLVSCSGDDENPLMLASTSEPRGSNMKRPQPPLQPTSTPYSSQRFQNSHTTAG